jgi:tetratricopeptide (TPR) repeat protein
MRRESDQQAERVAGAQRAVCPADSAGRADVAHYRVKIPQDARGPITFTAKLNYRKFAHVLYAIRLCRRAEAGQDPSLVGKAYNSLGIYDPKNIPKNVSGRSRIRFRPADRGRRAGAAQIRLGTARPDAVEAGDPQGRPRALERLGHRDAAPGEIKGAEYAFTTTQAEPGIFGRLAQLARALIQEGETDEAKPHVQKAIELNPSAGRNYFFRAMVEKADGDYPAAIASLRRVIQQYPRDRVALNQLARILFLSRDYSESLKVLADVGKVDRRICRCTTRCSAPRRGEHGCSRAGRDPVPAVQGRGVGAGDHRRPPACQARREQRAANDPRA